MDEAKSWWAAGLEISGYWNEATVCGLFVGLARSQIFPCPLLVYLPAELGNSPFDVY